MVEPNFFLIYRNSQRLYRPPDYVQFKGNGITETMLMNAGSASTVGQLVLQLAVTVLILAAVAVLAMVTVRFLRPKMQEKGDGARMSIVSRLSVGPRAAVVLLKVDERELLVGVTESNMTLLYDRPLPKRSARD